MNVQAFIVNEMGSFCSEAFYMFFSTLANRTRLCILDSLKEGPKTITELSSELTQETEIIAKNIDQLSNCVFIFSHDGKEKRYSLNRELIVPLEHLMNLHTKKYCPGMTECIPKEKLKEYMKKEASKTMYIEHE